MLEVKGLCKQYRPKHGVTVQALQDINIRFPETGMVFLLGRSGSGKSTLLNLLGGLDRYDSGEIILDGESTKKFSQADFDSYRNACLGFVFQEYNVLPEFNVAVNIALALELQGRTASQEEIDRILKEVDLVGYGARRPNELSGGQLQRVAIARALVKNPKIILADEPTGALDSATGRQIFETLKRLSETKLVIIVSHDREYSEQYADRIIELADGRIISDVTKMSVESGTDNERPRLDGGVCRIPGGYELTDEDREEINRYIAEHPQERLRIRVDYNLARGFSFEPTTEQPKEEGRGLFERIRSKLPMRRAIRIGLTGLKSKKVKLVFTILMSMMAFSMFGIASTLADYDYAKTVSDAFLEEGVKSVFVTKETATGGNDTYGRKGWNGGTAILPTDDLEMEPLRNMAGVQVNPVYRIGNTTVYYNTYGESSEATELFDGLNFDTISKWLEVDEETLKLYNCELVTGELPDGSKNEVAISKVTYDTILKNALLTGNKVPKMSDMIGRTVTASDGTELTITGIIDTGLDYMSYVNRITELVGSGLNGGKGLGFSIWSALMVSVVYNDFKYDVMSNPASCNLVGKGFVERQALSVFTSTRAYVSVVHGGTKTRVPSGSMVADIAFIDRIDHIDFAKTEYTLEKGVIPCYVSRDVAEVILRYALSSNNRKYLGIDEEIRRIYEERHEEFDWDSYELGEEDDEPAAPVDENGGESAEPGTDGDDVPGEGTDGSGTDVDGTDGKKDGEDASLYGQGDGTQYETDIALTNREKQENTLYLSSLSDDELAALLESVCVEAPVIVDITVYSGEWYSYGENQSSCYLDILGMLRTEQDGETVDYGCAFVGDPEALGKYIGKVNQPYGGAMVVLPTDRQELYDFVKYTHEGIGGVRFQMKTKYNVEIDGADIVMTVAGKVLIGIGIFFAAFAALLMSSFVASSIVYKKREVGILRAIGSRGSDVYRIFGSESCAIALICTVCASILTAVLTGAANYFLIRSFHVSLLQFGLKQILMIAAVAFGTALIATFLPVYMFARKRPIDAIRGR
ncbi:MAG: ATP-binding cassette domain-containing protein [Lachnospiraceae bacterium]|nr:ATP-binding cassette domain-containing protein [Lachnospiraceae bacterium]